MTCSFKYNNSFKISIVKLVNHQIQTTNDLENKVPDKKQTSKQRCYKCR